MVTLKLPIMRLWSLGLLIMFSYIMFQLLGLSADGAKTAMMLITVISGQVILKEKVSVLSTLVTFKMRHPLDL